MWKSKCLQEMTVCVVHQVVVFLLSCSIVGYRLVQDCLGGKTGELCNLLTRRMINKSVCVNLQNQRICLFPAFQSRKYISSGKKQVLLIKTADFSKMQNTPCICGYFCLSLTRYTCSVLLNQHRFSRDKPV